MSRNKFGLFLPLIAIAVGLLASVTAFGQSTATVQGSITDSKGAVVPSATVVVRNKATSIERTAQSTPTETIRSQALPAATYVIEVKANGFKTQLADQVILGVAQTVVQNFQLESRSNSEQVLVTSDVPVIETATTSVGTCNQSTNSSGNSTQRSSLRRPRAFDSRLSDPTAEWLPDSTTSRTRLVWA
jgi:hypothetical protein